MGILKNIWNTIFGKSKKQDNFSKGVDIFNPEMKVVHKKESPKVIAGYASGDTTPDNSKTCHHQHTNNFFASKEILSKEEKTDSFKSEKKKSSRNVIGQKTLSEIKDYLLTYGSIDVLTCEQKFKVKSLQNFIWHLRKDGLKIKTDKVGLHNELGQKVEVTNYRLIAKK